MILDQLSQYIPGSHNFGHHEKNIDPFTIAATGIQAGTAIYQTIQGNKIRNEAERELKNYGRQDLTNLADTLKFNNEGAQYKTQQYDRSFANAAEVLQRSGNVTGVNSLVQQSIGAKREIAVDLANQRQQLNQLKIQEGQRIQQMQEARERQDLAGIGAKAGYGQQQANQGIAGIASSGVTALNALGHQPLPTTSNISTNPNVPAKPMVQQTQPQQQNLVAPTNAPIFLGGF